ncbi:amidohydrolase [Devosia ginsengisoli]|uniref:amidohydrolase family protein n=1 Tax=Devosia ginsengisoli TaxID=400770 RepID=UPI0026EB9A22|nr:amidohydrolase family protein [Devosia ginsengisoli]MCR6670696.1 amidohydrolase family protein [Devosia ginsengisoli]
MIIDSHQHFWRLETGFYDWIPPADAALRRNFEASELVPQLRNAGIDGTILVQAANTEDELVELSNHAAGAGFVRGIVAPLEIGRAGTADRIARMVATPLLVGFRPPFRDLFDADGAITIAADAALSAIERHDLAFDCLALGPALGMIPALAKRYNGLRLIIDHGGNPDLTEGRVSAAWRRDMRAIAACPNTACKLSGLLTRLPAGADRTIVAEHVAILLDLFGPSRLLWGSDWPVLTKAASYDNWLQLCRALLDNLDAAETAAVFGGNAMRVYGLEDAHERTA